MRSFYSLKNASQLSKENLEDKGSSLISCTIGSIFFDKAVSDDCANINFMPLSAFNRLGLEEVTPLNIILQSVDRTITYPWGIVENLLVEVGGFIMPADFVVLDIQDD